MGRRAARVLGVVVLFAIVVILLWVFLNRYVAPTKPTEKKDLVLALAQILAGIALLSGLYFTGRTLQVNREGQITERFTRAIAQLGATNDDNSKNLELRLGGIYALERIARESEEDHWSIMEVLTAYVRQHAPWPPKEDQKVEDRPTKVSPPHPDIQAIMTVLRRRTRFLGHGEPEPLDLHETNLTKADLRRADLTRANLSGANLSGANLSEAILWEANVERADLTEANLTEAKLWGADLSKEPTLWEANVERADLSGADLSGVNFSGANLSEVDLSGANLSEADLSGADLWRAILSFETTLFQANVEGADLSETHHVTNRHLEAARGDKNTTALPPGFKPPAHWKD